MPKDIQALPDLYLKRLGSRELVYQFSPGCRHAASFPERIVFKEVEHFSRLGDIENAFVLAVAELVDVDGRRVTVSHVDLFTVFLAHGCGEYYSGTKVLHAVPIGTETPYVA